MGRIFLASASPRADLMSQLRDPSTGAWSRVLVRDNERAEFYRKAGIEHVPTRAVAIVDTGLISGHPEIGPLIDKQVDFTGRGTEDENGHGTLVALALLAQFPTQFAPRLINVKVAYADGRSGERELVEGMQWLADFIDSDHGYSSVVVNISLGYERRRLFRRPGCDGTCDVCRAARKVARAGVYITAAAGNRGVTLCPATAGLLGEARIAAVGALDLPTSAKGNVSRRSEVILALTSDLRDAAIAGDSGELERLAKKRAGFFGDAILAGDELTKEALQL